MRLRIKHIIPPIRIIIDVMNSDVFLESAIFVFKSIDGNPIIITFPPNQNFLSVFT